MSLFFTFMDIAELKLMSWNASGIYSSGSYLCDKLRLDHIDICGISEHWLRQCDLHFFDHLDSCYKNYAVCDRDLIVTNACYTRKGGVALLWHHKHSNRIVKLNIDDDRIIGIQYECSKHMYIYIFQVYLPSCNHPEDRYLEYIDKLTEIYHIYSQKGLVVYMGDFNGHLNSPIFQKRLNERSLRFKRFLNNYNLISVQTLKTCVGPRSTFVSYNGTCESLIDHVLIPCDFSDWVAYSEIVDDEALNVSNHRPILCVLRMELSRISSNNVAIQKQLKWDKASSILLLSYANLLKADETAINMLNESIETTSDINSVYEKLVSCLINASDATIPKSVYRNHLKPYWTHELTLQKRETERYRHIWINAGKPRDSEFFRNYKVEKSKFRKMHRHAVNDYMVSLNRAIDDSSEIDAKLFWKLVNGRKSKSCTDAGSHINFNGHITRNSEDIAHNWGDYFATLYSPNDLSEYDSDFHRKITENVAKLHDQIFQEPLLPNSHIVVSPAMIDTALKRCKKSKAAGEDNIQYEHLIYGGDIVRRILAKLFTAMLQLSFVPPTMKRGTITVLFKGGNKLRTDPNNYRAITLSSVIIRIYERIILQLIDETKPFQFNRLQGGFQEKLSCLMTSFSLKECIYFAQENESKLYVCFLDARKAFDMVWHDGLFSKLYATGIDQTIYKAVVSMYTDMQSRVRFRGYYSDLFPVLRGTKQGGVSSPKLYLLYIDGLLKEIESSCLGLCIFNTNLGSPTVADDMCLVSLAKTNMDKMLDICFRYSRKWHYEYNADKCAVVVFNESKSSSKLNNRLWHLGPYTIKESESYTHLGITLDKKINHGHSLEEAVSKLHKTFYGLIGCGLHEGGLHPITSLKVFNSVVIPKALYGCELWNNISRSELQRLERCHSLCIRRIQGLSRYSSATLSRAIIGTVSIENAIDYRKLIFLGQLCNTMSNHVAKNIFVNRLANYGISTDTMMGYIPDVMRLLDKYNMKSVVDTFIASGVFPSKHRWKNMVRTNTNNFELRSRNAYLQNKGCYPEILLNSCKVLSPMPIWLLAQQVPVLLPKCQSAAQLLSKLFNNEFTQVCSKCEESCLNIAVHTVFYCSKTETLRERLWCNLYKLFGHNIFMSLITLNEKEQLTNLVFGLCNFIESDTDREICLKTVVTILHRMTEV